ncbi:MAG TPA: tetratricopeptide repeat protein [Thermoanaerobaculia bacterium]|nr:tetratricopeptide repeat protein [Thermoanaerobaculia bacterium]
MKRLLVFAAALVSLTACSLHRGENPYEKPPFYSKYLNTGSALDAQIQKTLDGLRANPNAASLHNQLGMLLVQKGFPKDAERELERAVNADGKFYPGWYNLGLVRAANENWSGARFALHRAISIKPGYSQALFQLGLLEEKGGNPSEAVALYAKAFSINRSLLDVRVNPRLLDSKLTHLALIEMYPATHTRQSMQFQGAPSGYSDRAPEAPSTQPAGQDIITPSAPVTDPGTQKSPGSPAPQTPTAKPPVPATPSTTTRPASAGAAPNVPAVPAGGTPAGSTVTTTAPATTTNPPRP